MNYYSNLYDVNFLGSDSYFAQVRSASISIKKPGLPDWSTWRSDGIGSASAKALWAACLKSRDYDAVTSHSNLSADDRFLLCLVLCEDAYRSGDEKSFYFLNRILYASNIEDVQLKATKLQYAWQALSLLRNNCKMSLELILQNSLNYLNKKCHIQPAVKLDDIKVEIPVRLEWQRNGISFSDRKAVETFYKSTNSYILELTAANHQVETLFNYGVVIDIVKRLGISKLLDYGAGIGTFLLLAHYYGIGGTYVDLPSETMKYAVERFKSYDSDIEIMPIDEHFQMPQDLDCIVCTEVLEHIYEPEQLVELFHKSLRPGGILVVSESFDYIDVFCTHVPLHEGKGGEIFLDYLKEMGFTQIPVHFNIHPTIHMKA